MHPRGEIIGLCNGENLDSFERLTHTYPIHRGPCKGCASVVETGMLLVAGDIANCNSFRLIRIQAGNPTDTYRRIGNEVFFPSPICKRKATGIPPKRTDLFVFKRIIFSSVKCAVERHNNRLKRKSIKIVCPVGNTAVTDSPQDP